MSQTAVRIDAADQPLVALLPGGQEIHYSDRPGGDPTILFLHGYTDSHHSFDPLVEHLPSSWRLVALDQRGHGSSPEAISYTIGDFAGDAASFIETVIGKPVILIGHSLGSIIAQRLALLRPDLVRALILIGPAPTARGLPVLAELTQALADFQEDVPLDFIREFQTGTTFVEIDPAQLDIFVAESVKLTPATWTGTLHGLTSDEGYDQKLGAKLPALSLWGEQDQIFDAEAQVALARLIPRLQQIRYTAVGHAPHWEIPKTVAADIASFIANL